MATSAGGNDTPGTGTPSRRLAAIMFTDLVGYSALSHRDEELAIELLELHRTWVREILPHHGGREIETVGDAFLIEFAGALGAAECAVAIQRRFAEYNASAPRERRMELRIGIHAGDVEHRGDKVFGDGVNIASRIHGMAKPGGICVSEDVHHAVRNRRAFQFKSLGTPALKNIETNFELFELSPSLSLPPPADAAAPAVPKAGRRWIPAAAGAVVVLAAVASAGVWFGKRAPAEGDAPAVAVLPFENLSAEADSAFFTDGLHDTVIGHLSRIHGIKVISRTSVMRYRGQHPDLRQVARELGVGSILEGSVQRAGSKLRVAAQLIDADSDTHLWSTEYDRDVSDVFAVQADIASQVARAVQVKLTPQETASIRAIPTKSQEAYDLYLKARAAVNAPVSIELPEYLRLIAWLDEAVALDPGFAGAYALRSQVNDTIHWWGFDRDPSHREQARRDAEKAVALAPDLSEARVAMAVELYHGSLDYPGAIRELEVARRLAPSDSDPLFWLAMVQRRMGRWDDALANLEQVSRLDPLNPSNLTEYGGVLDAMRRLPEAAKAYERLTVLERDPLSRSFMIYNRFLQTGDADALVKSLGGLPREGEWGCALLATRAYVLGGLGRHDEAIATMGQCQHPSFVFATYNERVPTAHFMAMAKWRKDPGRLPKEAAVARAMMEKDLAATPDRSALRLFLAMNLVISGERERALQEVERALKDTPPSRDFYTSTLLLWPAAVVHANAGQVDRAFAELEQSLAQHGGIQAAEIRIEPDFAPLRSNPRYEKLLAGMPLKGGT